MVKVAVAERARASVAVMETAPTLPPTAIVVSKAPVALVVTVRTTVWAPTVILTRLLPKKFAPLTFTDEPLNPLDALSVSAAAAAGGGVNAATFTVNRRFAAKVKVGAGVGVFVPPTTATTLSVWPSSWAVALMSILYWFAFAPFAPVLLVPTWVVP
jgi:hypothetical protein